MRKTKTLKLAIFFIAVFGMGFFAFSYAARADIGTEDIKVTDTNGDGISLYRLTHPAYGISQRTTSGGDATYYNTNDTKVLFQESWDRDVLPDRVEFGSCTPNTIYKICQGYAWAEVSDLKNWWNKWKDNIKNPLAYAEYNNVTHIIPASRYYYPNYGIIWSKIPGEENIIYGVHIYSGNLQKFDISSPLQQWESTGIYLIPEGFSAYSGNPGYKPGYGPIVRGFAGDGTLYVQLNDGGIKFGTNNVGAYLVNLISNTKTEIASIFSVADTWKCLNNPHYQDPYNYNYIDYNGYIPSGHMHSRIINGVRWGNDHGFNIALLDFPPGSQDCTYFDSPTRQAYYGSKYDENNKVTSPSHLNWPDDNWFITDSCQWSPKYNSAPYLQQCYIVQRYFNTTTRKWEGDNEIIEWQSPNQWQPYTDAKTCSSDSDCGYISGVKGYCIPRENMCRYLIMNYDYFTEPNLNNSHTALGFTTGFYGRYSDLDYENYGKSHQWTEDMWDRNGLWHAEIQIGNSNPADINNDTHVNIKDIQICIKGIVDPESISETYLSSCQKVAPPIETVNIKDIQAIIQEIVNPSQ